MYVAIPLNKQFAFGLGVNAPFGLTTEYDDGWLGRYQALKSSITTVNVNPAMSWQVTPTFAVGAGINYQYIKATLTQNVNYSAALLAAAGQAGIAPGVPDLQRDLRGVARPRLEGDDHRQRRRVGLERRPRVGRDACGATGRRIPLGDQVQRDRQHRLREPAADADARARRRRSPAPSPRCPPPSTSTALYNRGVTSDITLPQIANLSMHWQIDPKWELMADVQYTGWSSIPELSVHRERAAGADAGAAELGRHLEDRGRRELPLQRPVEGALRRRVRPDAGHQRIRRRGCPTPTAGGSRSAASTGCTPNWKFDAGVVYIQGDSAEFQPATAAPRTRRRYGLINGSYDASVIIVSHAGHLHVRSAAAACAGGGTGRPGARLRSRDRPPPPPPPPAPAPAPAPTVQKITLDSKVLFDFDKAVLKPEGKAAIDSQVVGKLAQIQKLEVVLVSGHTDPLGHREAYNQKLSERRAETVRDYLVSKGVPKDKIEALGLGEKQLVPGVVCEQKNLKEKIACLQPHRRVEIQAKGEAVKR